MSVNPRKRPPQDRVSTQTPDPNYNLCKRQKRTDVQARFPPVFWNKLSKVHLTRTALQELECSHSAVDLGHNNHDHISTGQSTLRLSASAVKHLRRFSRQGGPDMSEARGRSRSASNRRRTKPSRAQKQNPTPTSSDQTRNSGPYDRNFQQHLIDHNIFPPKYEYPDGRVPQLPKNWEEIKERLCRPLHRQITEEDYQEFEKADAGALKEKQVSERVMPFFEGLIKDPKCVSGGIPFRNLEPLTDGTITPGNPDILHGARAESLHQPARGQLKKWISPSTQDDFPICPNFLVATKGPDGSLAVAVRQALYDGALGARGMHHLRNHKQAQPVYDNCAFTIACIYHGGTLKVYTVHCTEPTGPNGSPSYYMNQLNAWATTANRHTLEQAITGYENLKLWAEEMRNEAIDNVNKILRTLSTKVPSPSTPAPVTRIIEGETFEFTDNVSSPDSSQYATPPTIEYSVTTELDANKRTRQTQTTSPEQQQHNRNRVRNSPKYPSPESGATLTNESTGLSFRLDQSLRQEQDKFGGTTEPADSEEEFNDQSR